MSIICQNTTILIYLQYLNQVGCVFFTAEHMYIVVDRNLFTNRIEDQTMENSKYWSFG